LPPISPDHINLHKDLDRLARHPIIGQRSKSDCYAVQIVTIKVDDTTLRVYDQRDHLIKHVPRTRRKKVARHKAYGHTTNQKTG
jgi:hypothetical protein